MTTFYLAWRNLRRNRRRTILTASALCVGLTMMILSYSILDGTDAQSINNLVAYDLANVKAFTPGYLDEEFPDLDNIIENADSLIVELKKLDMHISVTPRLEMTGVLIHKGEELFIRMVGVDPVSDRDVFKTLGAVVDGETIRDDTPALLVGDRLAKDGNIKVGDVVTVLTRSRPGALNTRSLPVRGILSTGHPKVDGFAGYMPLETARNLAIAPAAATEIAIKTEHLEDSGQVAAKLAAVVPTREWRTWDSLANDFIHISRMKRAGQGVIILIFVIMAGVGIANTMIIAVHERVREIGTLRALGFSPSMVGGIFLSEGMFIGVIAGISALIFGSAIVSYLEFHGISLAAYENMDIGYPIKDAIYPILSIAVLIKSFLFGLVVSVLASWISARRAARGQVVRALREGML